jgi:hypothetical protein
VRDECVRFGSHKTIEEVAGSVPKQEKTLQQIKKTIFHWRDTKGGVTLLGGRSTRVKNK